MRLDRLNAMEKYILGQETASLEELASQFQISVNTVRRDVAELIARGGVQKVYGGVSSKIQHSPKLITERARKNNVEKELIGNLAAKLVKEGDSIFVDSGSTTPTLLNHLDDKNVVTVVSHSLNALYEASKHPNLNIIALGGVYSPCTSSYVGISTLEALSRLSIQLIFISATGVALETGLTNTTYLEAEIKRSVAKNGGKVILMADQSKFDTSSVITFCKFEDLYAIVTDRVPPKKYLDVITRHNIKLIYPGHESELYNI